MSSQTNKQSGIYPGWLMVLTGFTSMFIIYTTGISLMSLFIGPIAETFDISTTAASIQFSLITFSSMLGSLLTGKFIQKLGLRKAMLTAAVITVLTRVALAFSPSIWVNYLVAVVIGIFSPIVTTVGIAVMINRWFGKRKSGQALGIAMIGSGVGAMVLTPIVARIIDASPEGWRHAYLFLGALVLLIYLPMVYFFVKDSPESEGIEKQGVAGAEDGDGQASIKDSPDYGLKFEEAKSTSSFYIAIGLFAGIAFVSLLFFTLSYGYFSYAGYEAAFASTLMSVQALALIFGKYGMGALSSKTNPFTATLAALICQLIGIVFIIFSGTHVAVAVLGAVFFGLGNAAGTISIPLVTEEVFGNVGYGQIVGVMNMVGGLGSAIAPVISTSIVDLSGNQVLPWVIAVVILVLLSVATLVLQRNSKKLEDQRLPDTLAHDESF